MKKVYISCYENNDRFYKNTIVNFNRNRNETLFKLIDSNEASFNEEQRGFMTVDEIFNVANFSAKAKTGSTTYNNFINAGKAGWAIDAQTGKLSYTIGTPDASQIKIYQVDAAAKRPAVPGEVINPATTMVGAHTGGIVIQLPTAVADQEEVEITLTIEDGLGFTNDLKFVVKKIQ